MMDPYQILGVAPGASDDEVKKAYRQLARKYHPDANPGDKTAEQKMKDVNAAYDMIINKKVGPQGGYGQGGASQSYYGRSETGGGPQGGYGAYDDEDPFGGFGFGFGPFGTFFYGAENPQDDYGQGGYGSQNYGGYGSQGTYRQTYNPGTSSAGDPPQLQRAAERIQARDYDGALNHLNAVLLKDRNAKWYYYSALANHGVGNRIQARQDAAKAVQLEPGNREYQILQARLQGNTYSYQTTGHQYQRPAASLGSFCFTLCLMNFLCRYFPFCWC